MSKAFAVSLLFLAQSTSAWAGSPSDSGHAKIRVNFAPSEEAPEQGGSTEVPLLQRPGQTISGAPQLGDLMAVAQQSTGQNVVYEYAKDGWVARSDIRDAGEAPKADGLKLTLGSGAPPPPSSNGLEMIGTPKDKDKSSTTVMALATTKDGGTREKEFAVPLLGEGRAIRGEIPDGMVVASKDGANYSYFVREGSKWSPVSEEQLKGRVLNSGTNGSSPSPAIPAAGEGSSSRPLGLAEVKSPLGSLSIAGHNPANDRPTTSVAPLPEPAGVPAGLPKVAYAGYNPANDRPKTSWAPPPERANFPWAPAPDVRPK